MLTRTSYNAILQRWEEATVTMAQDIATELRQRPIDSPTFPAYLFQQTYFRSLSEAALFAVSSDRALRLLRQWFLRRLDSALMRAGDETSPL